MIGIPLYHASMRCKTLYISLPWDEERILKHGRTEVSDQNDFVETLMHRYPKRPLNPYVIDQMTLFEFLTWFDIDRSISTDRVETSEQSLTENPLWRTNYNEAPLLKTSALLPRIILSCGTVLIQHREPTCISFTCRYDDSMLAMYAIMSIGIPYRDPVKEFLDNKQGMVNDDHTRMMCKLHLETDIKLLHDLLVKHKSELVERFSTLPGGYKVQMMTALEHLCDLNGHDFVIKPRTSFIFTGDDEQESNDENNEDSESCNNEKTKDVVANMIDNSVFGNMDENNEERSKLNKNLKIDCVCTRTEELLKSANSQQRYLASFVRQYLMTLMAYEQNHDRLKDTQKPHPFHIVVNGLAGSGKSYAISIIEQMLEDFCISEAVMRNRPRKRKGLLKMAHTGKAALNILGWTIHSALGMVDIFFLSDMKIIDSYMVSVLTKHQHQIMFHHLKYNHFEIDSVIYY